MILFTVYALKCVVAVVSYDIRVGFISSTDTLLKSQLNAPVYLYENSSEALEEWLDDMRLDVVYDLTHSTLTSYRLSGLARDKGFVHIIGWSHPLAAKTGSLYPHYTRNKQIASSIALLEAMNITEVLLITNEFDTESAFPRQVQVVASCTVASDIPQASLDKLVKRSIKSEGVRTIFIDLPAHLAEMTLTSLDRARMIDEGYAIICSPQSLWLSRLANYTGPLMLIEDGTEQAESEIESELLNLEWLLKYLSQRGRCEVLKECIATAFESRHLKLLNLIENTREVVGEISSGYLVSIDRIIVYPGNSTSSFTPVSSVTLKVSTISSGINPNGEVDQGNTDTFQGFFVALTEVSRSNLLGRFELKARQIDCGASGYNPSFAYACIEREQHDLGIAIIGAYSSGATVGVLEAMKRLNLKQPLIGSQCTSSLLSSKEQWPNFMRTIKISSSVVPGFVQFMLKYGYMKTSLFYSDETFGSDFASAMMQALDFNNIEVVNPPVERALNEAFLAKPFDFLQFGKSFLASGVRPVIFLMLPPYKAAIMDVLYAAGVRTDDIYCLHQAQDTVMWADGSPADTIENRMSLNKDTVNFEQAAFSGVLGEHSKALISDTIQAPATSGQCQFYDSCYLLVYALQSMIKRGEDFEDPDELNVKLRDTVFYGCSGKVQIDRDSNDRRDQDVDVFNLREIGGSYGGVLVLKISLTSAQMFEEIDAITWPGGTAAPPQLYRLNYKDCPFPEEERHNFDKGKALIQYLCMGYFGFTAAMAGIIFFRSKYPRSVEFLREAVDVTFQDRVVLGLLVLDFVQYVGYGPVLTNGQDAFQNLIDFANGGTQGTIQFTKGMYWTVLNSVLTIVLTWFVFCVLLWMKYQDIRVTSLKWLTGTAEISMPLLGNAFFLPIVAVLFDVFVCYEVHGPKGGSFDFNDSFLYRDCYVDCWKGVHLNYVIAASIALLFYHPVTVFTRPLWQLLVPDIHIMTAPSFYLQKSLVEVTLVVIRRGIREDSAFVHGIIYLLVISMHITLSLIRKPFNYPRLNLWFCFSQLLVIWIGAASLFQSSNKSSSYFLGSFFGVSGGILGTVHTALGILIQTKYYPNLLLSRKDPNLPQWFRFAFNMRNVKPPEVGPKSQPSSEFTTITK